MSSKASFLCAVAAVSVALVSGPVSAATFAVSAVEFGAAGDFVDTRVRELLGAEGLLAVTEVPGLAKAREDALVAMAQCTLMYGEHVAPVSIDLKDSSKRASWGAFVRSSDRSRDPVDATAECPGLQAKMERLRDVVDVASEYFVQLLDSAMKIDVFDMGMMSKKGSAETYNSFGGIVNNADHLDHFHVYEKQGNKGTALDLHTDQGLFIAIVPAIRVSETGDVTKEEDSFYVEVGNVEAKVKVPANGDAIVFMIGDGINFLRRASHHFMRPVPHSLNLIPQTQVRSVRAWFGRMFFAPKDALLNGQDKETTFQSLIDNVVEARKLNKEYPSLSCSQTEGQPLRVLDSTTCLDTQIYCWMACRNATNLGCPVSEVICLNGAKNGTFQDCDNCHDMGAKPACSSVLNPTLVPTVGSAAGVIQINAVALALFLAVAMILGF